HQHVLIMGAIENYDGAFGRHVGVDAREKIVRQLLWGWLFEVSTDATLWIHPGEDVADRAVFAGSVESLQYNEKRMLVLRIHQILQLIHLLHVLLYLRQSCLP